MAEKKTEGKDSILHLPIPKEAVDLITDVNRTKDVYLVIKLGGGEDHSVWYVSASTQNPDQILREMKSVTNKPQGSIFGAMTKLAKLFEKYFGGRVRADNDAVAD